MGGGAVGKAVNALVNTLVPTFLNVSRNALQTGHYSRLSRAFRRGV